MNTNHTVLVGRLVARESESNSDIGSAKEELGLEATGERRVTSTLVLGQNLFPLNISKL